MREPLKVTKVSVRLTAISLTVSLRFRVDTIHKEFSSFSFQILYKNITIQEKHFYILRLYNFICLFEMFQ